MLFFYFACDPKALPMKRFATNPMVVQSLWANAEVLQTQTVTSSAEGVWGLSANQLLLSARTLGWG